MKDHLLSYARYMRMDDRRRQKILGKRIAIVNSNKLVTSLDGYMGQTGIVTSWSKGLTGIKMNDGSTIFAYPNNYRSI